MKAISDIEKRLQVLKPVLAEKYKVQEIGLFGSYAKGKQSDSSDIDILIDLQEPLGWGFFELKEYLETQLNRPSDLVTEEVSGDGPAVLSSSERILLTADPAMIEIE